MRSRGSSTRGAHGTQSRRSRGAPATRGSPGPPNGAGPVSVPVARSFGGSDSPRPLDPHDTVSPEVSSVSSGPLWPEGELRRRLEAADDGPSQPEEFAPFAPSRDSAGDDPRGSASAPPCSEFPQEPDPVNGCVAAVSGELCRRRLHPASRGPAVPALPQPGGAAPFPRRARPVSRRSREAPRS